MEKSEFVVDPKNLYIEPGANQRVYITVHAKSKDNPIRRLLNMEIIGHSIYKAIDLCANVIDTT